MAIFGPRPHFAIRKFQHVTLRSLEPNVDHTPHIHEVHLQIGRAKQLSKSLHARFGYSFGYIIGKFHIAALENVELWWCTIAGYKVNSELAVELDDVERESTSVAYSCGHDCVANSK